jgi:hypothetical protein
MKIRKHAKKRIGERVEGKICEVGNNVKGWVLQTLKVAKKVGVSILNEYHIDCRQGCSYYLWNKVVFILRRRRNARMSLVTVLVVKNIVEELDF